MVTLWSRIRKGVKGIGDTEWALLGFETVGIVFGVLLAVQVGNWIEDRKEAREQREQLERLHLESQEAVRLIRGTRDRLGGLEEQMNLALASWINEQQCPTPLQWSVFGAVGVMPAITPQRAAYDEMLGSGGLNRIKNPQAREAIADFYSTLDFHQQQLVYFRQISQANFPDLGFGRDVVSFEPETGRAEYSDGNAENACRNSDLRVSVFESVGLFSTIQDVREQLAEDAIKMCVAVARELGEECIPSESEPLSEEDLAIARGESPSE